MAKAKLYSFKSFLRDRGLTKDQFNTMSRSEQERLKSEHQDVLKIKLAERDEHVFRYYFLAELKHVDPNTFDDLAEWKQEEWRRQYAKWKKDEEYRKRREKELQSQDRLEYENAMSILHDCGVPFGPDGPLGIGWDD